jgi:dTDP-4-amino-4,6-dideoxygalactose transaminase
MSGRRHKELAILGGTPAFETPLHVGRPNLGDQAAFQERLNRVWSNRWFTNDGPLVREFEQQIASLLGVRHCVAVCNATAGLQLAIRSLGLHGEVIVPSFTFVATAQALAWQEIKPVFCDVAADTHTLDPNSVERLITPRTTGVLGVHLWGNPCAVDRLTEICRRRGLALLFDAAHAFCCDASGKMVGNFGDAEVFSFHATKFVQSAEGGAVVTNNDALARELRLARNFGFVGYDQSACLGTNAKMSELSAAMGLTSLDSMEAFLAANRSNHVSYEAALRELPGLALMEHPPDALHNRQYVVVRVAPDICPLNRDELVAVLHAEQVLARRYFYPGCHHFEQFRFAEPEGGWQLPVTDELCRTVLQLPTGSAVGVREIAEIGRILEDALAQAPAVREALSAKKAERD